MKKCLQLFLVCLCLGFASCSDDNDDSSLKAYVPETYDYYNGEYPTDPGSIKKWIKTDKAELRVGQVGIVKIEGGSGEYTATSENEDIAEILWHPHDSNVYTISNNGKLGSTTITIKDKDSNSLSITITFGEYTEVFALCNSNPGIIVKEGQNDAEEAIVKDIMQKIVERNILKGSALELTYNKSNSGKISIKDNKDKELHSGTFERSLDNQYNHLIINIDNKEYDYIVTNDISGLLREVGPQTTYFVEDLTELFKTDYPKITKVLVGITVCI